MQLQYSFRIHHLQESEQCEKNVNTCVDFVRLDHPTYNTDETSCGSKEQLDAKISLDGMNELDIEFATNRRTESPGFEMMVYCRDPALDAHHPSSKSKRSAERCTLPNGYGPRDEPFNPPQVCYS